MRLSLSGVSPSRKPSSLVLKLLEQRLQRTKLGLGKTSVWLENWGFFAVGHGKIQRRTEAEESSKRSAEAGDSWRSQHPEAAAEAPAPRHLRQTQAKALQEMAQGAEGGIAKGSRHHARCGDGDCRRALRGYKQQVTYEVSREEGQKDEN